MHVEHFRHVDFSTRAKPTTESKLAPKRCCPHCLYGMRKGFVVRVYISCRQYYILQ